MSEKNNLAYIEELGIGIDTDTDGVKEEALDAEFVQEQDDSPTGLDSEVNDSEEPEEGNTEPNSEYLESLKKQIEGMEKRIADKDAYINELREASKQKEAEKDQQKGDTDEDGDFWENPELTIKQLKEALKEQKQASQLQQLQIQETVYANTVENYWKTVNPEALKNAVATDPEFAEKFNKSTQPYRIAYEYLTAKSAEKTKSEQSLRDKIKQELMAEMGIKKSKEAPPTIGSGTSSNMSKKEVPSDGFASVFGSEF